MLVNLAMDVSSGLSSLMPSYRSKKRLRSYVTAFLSASLAAGYDAAPVSIWLGSDTAMPSLLPSLIMHFLTNAPITSSFSSVVAV